MNKASLSERDICTKYILPALSRAGWDPMFQLRQELEFTNGWITVVGTVASRARWALVGWKDRAVDVTSTEIWRL